MPRALSWIVLCVLPWGLTACRLMDTGKRRQEKARAEAAEAAAAMPPGLIRSSDGGQSGGAVSLTDPSATAPTAPGAPAAAPGMPAITPESDIVWTDPDNPDADIPELDTVLQQPSRGPWEVSATIAAKRAVREGKCLLIWFTDSQRSPNCKSLSAELFSLPEYEKWAGEKFVSLRVDSNVTERDMDKRTRMIECVEAIRKKHKVLGCPTVIVCAPQGEVIARYRGYSQGQGEFYWGRLKSAELLGNKAYQTWRAGLEKRGYREWSDRHGRKLLARLAGYKDGELWLIEPDGTRARTQERKLSDADRQWITEQKRARGLQ